SGHRSESDPDDNRGAGRDESYAHAPVAGHHDGQLMLLRFFIVIALIAPQMPSRDASITSALAALNKGRVLEPTGEFTQIVRSDPLNGPAYFYLSTLYTQMNEFELGERYLRRAMELNPAQSAHYLQLGLIRYRQKQWTPALEFLKKALELGAGGNAAAVW